MYYIFILAIYIRAWGHRKKTTVFIFSGFYFISGLLVRRRVIARKTSWDPESRCSPGTPFIFIANCSRSTR